MFKRFKNIQLRPLLSHLIITLIYPVVKACISERNKLLVFTDALTIAAGILVIGGVIYAMILHGDFDISGYLMKRGVQKEPTQTYYAYLYDVYAKREGAFNYALFLGLVYIAAAAILGYAVI